MVPIAAELTGLAQRAMDMAVAYAKERHQFERPIGAYQAVSHACARMLYDVEEARSLTYYAAWAADAEPESLPMAAAMAKARGLGCGLGSDQVLDPGPRRDRLHLGARPALPAQAGAGGRELYGTAASIASGSRRWRGWADSGGGTLGYLLKAVLGAALFVGAVVVFNVKLIALLETGTCASGNTPYEIARPCPEGTGTDMLLLVGSIFAGLVGAGLFAARGRPPWRERSRDGAVWSSGLLAWALFFSATGAVSLIHALSSETIGPDGELGGIIVGATFLLMGLPALPLVVSLAVGRPAAGARARRGRLTRAARGRCVAHPRLLRRGQRQRLDLIVAAGAAGGRLASSRSPAPGASPVAAPRHRTMRSAGSSACRSCARRAP